MKTKIVSRLLWIGAICSIGYFIALQIVSPSVLSFSYVWLFAGCLCLFFIFQLRKNKTASSVLKVLHRFRTAVFILFCFGIVVAGSCLFRILTPVLSDGTENARYLIVLGGGVERDGTLGPVPRRRLERAAVYLKTHGETTAIVTGGKGPFAPCAEAPVLARNLESLGIPGNRILEEGRALDTIQNFAYSARLAAAQDHIPVGLFLKQPVIVVTSDFHLARAERLARREGYHTVYGIASGTPALFVINSYAREICAYIKLELRILLTGKPEPLFISLPLS